MQMRKEKRRNKKGEATSSASHSDKSQRVTQTPDGPSHQNLFTPADNAFQQDPIVINEQDYYSPNFAVANNPSNSLPISNNFDDFPFFEPTLLTNQEDRNDNTQTKQNNIMIIES